MRQVTHGRSGSFDDGNDPIPFVTGEIVHHHTSPGRNPPLMAIEVSEERSSRQAAIDLGRSAAIRIRWRSTMFRQRLV